MLGLLTGQPSTSEIEARVSAVSHCRSQHQTIDCKALMGIF
jgi:hypothetical protein